MQVYLTESGLDLEEHLGVKPGNKLTVVIGDYEAPWPATNGDTHFKLNEWGFLLTNRDNIYHNVLESCKDKILEINNLLDECLIGCFLAVKEGDIVTVLDYESRSHPRNQVVVLEAFAVLANLGVQVVISTYSPYVLAHLQNLSYIEEEEDYKKFDSSLLYMQDPRAFLSSKDIEIYEEQKDRQLVSQKLETGEFNWGPLSDMSVELQQKYFLLRGY